MKRKAIALLLAAVMLFTGLPFMHAQAYSAEIAVCNNGEKVSSVTLNTQEKVTLSAKADTAGDYQWQIRVAGDTWANIVGETGDEIELSYAMVANMLNNNGAEIRCRLTSGENKIISNTVCVNVDTEAVYAFPAVNAAQTVFNAAAASAVSPLAEDEPVLTTHLITITYVLEDGTPVAPPFTAQVADGSAYHLEVTSPVFVGYAPDNAVVTQDYEAVTADIAIQVIYRPAQVNFTVNHYQQNIDDDGYTLFDTAAVSDHVTGSTVGAGLEKNYDGFMALLYDENTKVAADGSTVVNIYYDRMYYLMTFDLGGGYGVEPIYARYGTPIVDLGTPVRAGYTFNGWTPTVPETMPVGGGAYTANWTAADTAKVTVVFWGENANDEEYSYERSDEVFAKVGEEITYGSGYLVCTLEEHTHTADCYGCGQTTEHTHSTQCYSGVGNKANSPWLAPNNPKQGQVYSSFLSGKYIYIGNSWYNYSGSTAAGQIAPTICTVHVHTEDCCICGKQEHTHNSSCYLSSGMDSSLWKLVKSDTVTVAADGSTIMNVYYDRLEFTLTFKEQGNRGATLGTIKAKWGADIREQFQTISEKNTFFWSEKTNGGSPWTSFLSAMPAENRTYYRDTVSGNTKNIATYLGQRVDGGSQYDVLYTVTFNGGNLNVTEEEFVKIDGFTFNENRSAKLGDKYNGAKFYYDRNQYILVLNNGETNEHTEKAYYQAPLSKYSADVYMPTLPSFYEPGSRVFGGWYQNPECTGEKYDLTAHTMPASDMILYAKWIPVSYTVTTRLTESAADKIDTWTVPHGMVIQNPPANPTNGEYEFVGWFYRDGDGEEKAFDFSTQIRRDMDLYAKWRSNKIMPFTIHYVTVVNGEKTKIAEDYAGSGLAGTTKTVDAKTGSELFEDYREGYFPETSSHNLEIRIEGDNEYTFVYVAKEEVQYTVKYLEEGTNNVLSTEKTASSKHAVVTEEYVRIAGYRPDAFQKRLVLSANEDENVLIFYYEMDAIHAPVQITHYIENISGGGYTVYQDETKLDAVIGNTYSADALTIPGFTFAPSAEGTLTSGELTAAGLHLKLYYTRNSYPYEFRFAEFGTGTTLAPPATGNAKYQASVTENAKQIEGYTLVGASQQQITIVIEDGTTAVKNVKTFLYTENEVTISYEVVGPTGCGSVDPASEIVKVKTGTAAGSTPTATDGYRFVGWYADAECTQSVNAAWVNVTNKLTPEKSGEFFTAATYYAKFVPDVADLTITKSGAQGIDENQSFVFHVVGDGLDGTHTDMKVVIHGNGSVTIKDLPCGTYTVTEETTWSWRYTPTDGTQNVNLTPADATVGFGNTRTADKWLNGAAWCDNRWIDGQKH